MSKKIIMLVGGDHSSYAIYNGLKAEYNIAHVILEKPKSRKEFIKRRIKKLGLVKVIGQVLFQKLVVPFLKKESQSRVDEIIEKNKLTFTDVEKEKLINVPSANSEVCIKTLKEINPDIVIVNGTRIISKKVLTSINGTFINTHAGLTPLYRGIHGAYWSKVNKDGHCGVSVHLVDPGIDTGGILYQDLIETNRDDNFVSYTYLQLAKGIDLMKRAINDLMNNNSKVITNNLDSKFWTHPTIWFYLHHRLFNKVK
ncbi:formyl transferase [Hwangdonia lutea]|uniref:phosphoribosylglycinamide formyltransferase 1 n=1 Tax=Hwangdonia lutea TaxID=3075823 RepID=A0AA97EKY1_9FLAO|nr:formyl transferase [Hwangdonia sp. SCSIO 19198]WOD43359.1 formyl transferase [Hwangdonia sp. SCSIO 19198]